MDSTALLLFGGPYLPARDLLALACLDRRARQEAAASVAALKRKQLGPGVVWGFQREVACCLLQAFWKALLQARWIDRVASSLATLHAFPHRLKTNLLQLQRLFGGGLAAIPRIRRTRRFLSRLRASYLCPRCSRHPIRSAVYQQIGEKMACSTPHIFFACSSCCDDFAEDPCGWEYIQIRWDEGADDFWRDAAPILLP
jgi:hypothetical protein